MCKKYTKNVNILIKYAFIICFILCLSNEVKAGGFQVPVLCQKQNAMGVAGTGVCLDASSIMFNPGASAFLKKSAIQGSIAPLIGRIQYLERAPGTYSTTNNFLVGLPFSLFAQMNIPPKNQNTDLKVGLGIYSPFGTRLSWPTDWKGRYVVQDISLYSVFIQPTVSYKLGNRIGFGLGMILAYGGVDLTRAIPLENLANEEGQAQLSGATFGYGLNLGLYIQPTKKISIGLNYRSPVSLAIKNGEAKFNVPNSIKNQFPDTKFSTALTLPQGINLGVGYRPTKKLLLLANLDFTNWSVVDSIKFDFAQNTDALQDESQARRYNNSVAFRLGAQFEGIEDIPLRAGLLIDQTPIDDNYISPELPDNTLYGITCGAGFNAIKNLQIDISFMFIFNSARNAQLRAANFGGTYQSFLFIPGVGAQFMF